MTKKANPHRGEVEVVIDGERFTLVPTFEAMAEIESATGKSLVNLYLAMIDGNWLVTDLCSVFLAGVHAGGNQMEAAQARKLVMEAPPVKLLEPLGKFVEGALTGGKDADEDAPDADTAEEPDTGEAKPPAKKKASRSGG